MRFWLTAAFCLLAACAPPRVAYLTNTLPTGGSQHPIFVAKSGLSDRGPNLFDSGRVPGMEFGRAVVSIPADYEVGTVSWPAQSPPDPERHFTLAKVTPYPGLAGFARAVDDAVPRNETERVVLVHGYNMTVSKATFSAAQIQKDFGIKEPIVAFSWPSSARPRGYLYDRDSTLFARSDLVALLAQLTKGGTDQVVLVAHSMGASLAMEALRQLALTGDRRTLERISSVILVAPDLDPDVFRRQAAEIGTLPEPFVVFVAQNDDALRLSSFLTLQPRLGSIRNASDVGDLPVTLIDVSALADGNRFNHEIALTSPSAVRILRGAMEGDPSALQALDGYLVPDGAPLLLPQ